MLEGALPNSPSQLKCFAQEKLNHMYIAVDHCAQHESRQVPVYDLASAVYNSVQVYSVLRFTAH